MILVTAATGNAGFPIVKALSERSVPCRALVRDPAKTTGWNLPHVEIATGDLLDKASLESAMQGVHKLMLISPPAEHLAEMEAGAIEVAARAGVKQVVKFSAGGADPKSPTRFGRVHGESEKNIEKSGLTWTFLRPTFFAQNLLGMAGMVKSGTIYVDAADGKAPFVDLADVAAVAAVTLTSPGHERHKYEITGPTAYSYFDIAAIFTRWLKRSVKYVPVPHPAALEALVKAGVPQWQAEGITEISAQTAMGNFARPTDVVRRVTGKNPKALEKYLRENLAAFQ